MRQIRKVQSTEPSQRTGGEQKPQAQITWASGTDPVPSHEKIRCLYRGKNHALKDCQSLRWKPYQEKIHVLFSDKLSFSCLRDEHVSKFCPRTKTCKTAKCKRTHPTILYTQALVRDQE